MTRWITQLTIAGISVLLARAGGAQADGRSIQERLGYPASARLIVIHADDLGMAHSVNRATFMALVSSVRSTLMSPAPMLQPKRSAGMVGASV